jgi:ATP-dependent Zn protease
MTIPTLRRTAWHEAGHAVVAWDQKLTVKLVSIRRDAKELWPYTEQTRASDCDPERARRRENIVAMGGWAAENASGEASDGQTYDGRDLQWVLSRIPDGKVAIELGWAEQEADRIVRANLARVERLATVLMQRIELTDADEIRDIIEGHNWESINE